MKAPSRKKAAWPIEIWPVKPTRMFSPSAAIEKMPIWIRILSQYPLKNWGAKHSSSTPTIAKLRLVVVGKIVVSAA
ncbi:hypothetical protein ACVWXM_007021 [Bradyrhizobium sp. GM7.3]